MEHVGNELEDLANINKNDFLPLVDKINIKQELTDTAGSGNCGAENGAVAANIGSEENSETGNLLCDSVQKQVRHHKNNVFLV